MDLKDKCLPLLWSRPCIVAYILVSLSSLAEGAALQFQPFVGVMGVINTLSADASSQAGSQGLSASLYKPENGPSLQAFAGVHVSNYFSVQANYVWRHNDLSLSSTAPRAGDYYVESRNSSQQGFVVDALIYFRPLTSRVRPYLAVGTGFVRFQSFQTGIVQLGNSATPPPTHFSSVKAVFDSPVGIDLAIAKRISFRYSFAETLRHNDISDRLSPRGKRGLADYQNMFGVVFRL